MLTISLGHDAVGPWELRKHGTEWFDLDWDRLLDFHRPSIRHLLAEGASPIRLTKDGWWLRQDQLGDGAGEILESVLTTRAGPGKPVPGVDAIWFGRTDVLDVR